MVTAGFRGIVLPALILASCAVSAQAKDQLRIEVLPVIVMVSGLGGDFDWMRVRTKKAGHDGLILVSKATSVLGANPRRYEVALADMDETILRCTLGVGIVTAPSVCEFSTGLVMTQNEQDVTVDLMNVEISPLHTLELNPSNAVHVARHFQELEAAPATSTVPMMRRFQ